MITERNQIQAYAILFVALVKKVSLIVEIKEIYNSRHERLLGVKIDSKLSFNTHLDDICKKSSIKLNALSRITPHSDFKKKKLLITSFLFSSLTIAS